MPPIHYPRKRRTPNEKKPTRRSAFFKQSTITWMQLVPKRQEQQELVQRQVQQVQQERQEQQVQQVQLLEPT
jgi:hypothetical protein